MFLQLRTTIGGTGEKQSSDRSDVAETKDLRDKTGDVVSDLKISSDLRRSIYALELHTNTFFSNSSGLTVLTVKRIQPCYFILGDLRVCKWMLIGGKFHLMVVAGSNWYYKKMMPCSYKKYMGGLKL